MNNDDLRKFLKKKRYKKPVTDDELSAIRRCVVIQELGYPVTHERIEQELKINREKAKHDELAKLTASERDMIEKGVLTADGGLIPYASWPSWRGEVLSKTDDFEYNLDNDKLQHFSDYLQ